MKRGFTLLEIIVVIIILGVLATLGLTQYGSMIEKSRGAEAKAILGDLRKLGAAFYLENQTLNGITNSEFNLGTDNLAIPSTCRSSHYFSYAASGSGNTLTSTATRCGQTGKSPSGGAKAGSTIRLVSDFGTGTDTWTSSGY